MHVSVADPESSVFELICQILIRITRSNLDPEPNINFIIYLYTGMHVFIFFAFLLGVFFSFYICRCVVVRFPVIFRPSRNHNSTYTV